MATYVVDANVIVQACIDAAGLGSLSSHDLKAPPVMRSEALSSLHEMRYRGEVSTELAGLALKRLSAMAVEVLGPESLAGMAWDVAESLGWAKTYDAEYVALAQILECPVVTLDARMARGARRLTRIIGPGDVATEAAEPMLSTEVEQRRQRHARAAASIGKQRSGQPDVSEQHDDYLGERESPAPDEPSRARDQS